MPAVGASDAGGHDVLALGARGELRCGRVHGPGHGLLTRLCPGAGKGAGPARGWRAAGRGKALLTSPHAGATPGRYTVEDSCLSPQGGLAESARLGGVLVAEETRPAFDKQPVRLLGECGNPPVATG
jgi:hypothetical protein